LLVIAALVGVGSGLGAVVFRDLIYLSTWLATGHVAFGQAPAASSAQAEDLPATGDRGGTDR
jgi:CIC family chloride channel protein